MQQIKKPLHCAALAKRLENVKVLIRKGAEVNATEHGDKHTALHLACIVDAESVIKELIKANAEVNQRSKFGITAMYYAKKNEKITVYLRKHGRDGPEVLDELDKVIEEMAEIKRREFLPKLTDKVISLDEIRKRDKALIAKDFAECSKKGDDLVDKVNEILKELNKRKVR